MKIALFGPPGIGKSWLVKRLDGYDAEDDWPDPDLDRVRSSHVVGAAGLQPDNPVFQRHLKVLLYMPQHLYEKRRAERDAKHPEKATQDKHHVDAWLQAGKELGLWDMVLRANRRALAVLSLFRKLPPFPKRKRKPGKRPMKL
jgi:ATPase subunit of ABC transporter with duplicated ATPase domains